MFQLWNWRRAIGKSCLVTRNPKKTRATFQASIPKLNKKTHWRYSYGQRKLPIACFFGKLLTGTQMCVAAHFNIGYLKWSAVSLRHLLSKHGFTTVRLQFHNCNITGHLSRKYRPPLQVIHLNLPNWAVCRRGIKNYICVVPYISRRLQLWFSPIVWRKRNIARLK